jgi:hypothetical protein
MAEPVPDTANTEDEAAGATEGGLDSPAADTGEANNESAATLSPDNVPESSTFKLKKIIQRLMKVLLRADVLADSTHLSPSRYPRSGAGAIVSFCVVCIVGAILSSNLIAISKLVRMSVSAQRLVNLNYVYYLRDNNGTILGKPSKYADVPSIELSFDSKTVFYEATSGLRSVGKITITDNLGLTPEYTSNTDPTIHVSSAAYAKIRVPLNSWDPALVEMPSSSISAMRLSDMLANDVLQSERERVEDIASKLLKNRQPAEFFAHHAKLYVKFDRAQLKGLKSCQLQVSFVLVVIPFTIVSRDTLIRSLSRALRADLHGCRC